jgi:hypothetical protein
VSFEYPIIGARYTAPEQSDYPGLGYWICQPEDRFWRGVLYRGHLTSAGDYLYQLRGHSIRTPLVSQFRFNLLVIKRKLTVTRTNHLRWYVSLYYA